MWCASGVSRKTCPLVRPFTLFPFSLLPCKVQKTHFSRFSRPTTRTHLPTILYPRKLSSHCIFLFIILLVNTRSSIVIYSFTVFRADGYRWYRYHWSIGRTIETRHFFVMERDGTNNRIAWNFYEKSLNPLNLRNLRVFIRLDDPRIFANNYIYMYLYIYIWIYSVRKKIYVYMCV